MYVFCLFSYLFSYLFIDIRNMIIYRNIITHNITSIIGWPASADFERGKVRKGCLGGGMHRIRWWEQRWSFRTIQPIYIYISAKFTLNSKRFPRLKSTFPLWLNLQSSPRYIQNEFQPSSHFFLDRKPFELVLCLLLGWTFLNYLCRRCSNALGSRGLGMLKKLFRA